MSEKTGGAAPDDVAERALLARLAAAEPRGTAPLSGLLERLRAAGRLRAVIAPGGQSGGQVHGEDVGRADVAGIAYDSRRGVRGGCFVAVPGSHVDGHAFAAAAVRAGAAVLVVEQPLAPGDAGPAIQLVVDRSQLALATVAAWWYADPAAGLGIIGITGTDGKTTRHYDRLGQIVAEPGLAAVTLVLETTKTGDVDVTVSTARGVELGKELKIRWRKNLMRKLRG